MPDGPQETDFHEPLRDGSGGDPLKVVPVLFVLGTISTLYMTYSFCHCLPMLTSGNQDVYNRGVTETTIFNCITFMLLLSYIRCVLVHPGEVPNRDPWLYTSAPTATVDMQLKERKAGGERRHCKWCGKYKPDRCHHCRPCNTCILKMDHHCPWIYNCVGFHNYKYFVLLLFYTVLATHFIVWTMTESMVRVVEQSAAFHTMFFTLFGITLAFFLGSLATPFFGFHIWLTCMGLTTIEFCEKRLPKKSAQDPSSDCFADCTENDSIWNLGCFRNVAASFGSNPLMWLIPFSGPSGDGLLYEVYQQPEYRTQAYMRDFEAGRGTKKSAGLSIGRRSLLDQTGSWTSYGAAVPPSIGTYNRKAAQFETLPNSLFT